MDRQEKIKLLEQVREGVPVDLSEMKIYLLSLGKIIHYENGKEKTVSVEQFRQRYRTDKDWFILIVHGQKLPPEYQGTDPSDEIYEQLKINPGINIPTVKTIEKQ